MSEDFTFRSSALRGARDEVWKSEGTRKLKELLIERTANKKAKMTTKQNIAAIREYVDRTKMIGAAQTLQHLTSLESTIAELVDLVKAYKLEYPAFRSMPVGAPHSEMRDEQDYQIELEDRAIKALERANGRV